MKKILTVLTISLLSLSAFAQAKPSDASVEELLTINDSKKLIEGTWPQVETTFKNAFKESLGSASLNSEQQKIADNMNAQLAAAYKNEFSWEKMKPVFIQSYKDTFSQEEVDGMLAFYKSDAGKAVLQKMPLVMQSTSLNVQQQMTRVMPKLQKIQQDSLSQIQAKADSTK